MIGQRHFARFGEQALVIDEHHRAIVAQRRLEQAIGIGRGGRGLTPVSPGTPIIHASMHCEWATPWPLAPAVVLTTMGTRSLPPVLKRALAA